MDLRTLITHRLNDHLDELGSFVSGLTDHQLHGRPENGESSLADLTVHLADIQEGYLEMVSRILLEENPPLQPVCLNNHHERSTSPTEFRSRLKDFDLQRRGLISLLTALADHHWKREGQHPIIRHYTLEKCLEELMRHEESHFFEMYQMFFGAESRE